MSADDLEPNETIDTEYEHGVRVIRVDRGDEPPRYRFDAPMFKVKRSDNTPEWENPHSARMYAAVYVAVGGFREEKTGRRGIPLEVERAGRQAVLAYLSTQPGMTPDYLAHQYDLPRQRIYEYRSRIRHQAEEELLEE